MSYLPTSGGLHLPIRQLTSMEVKESILGNLLYMQGMGNAVWPTRDYATFAKFGYMQNVIVFRCINMIVSNASNVPLFVRQGKKDMNEHEFISLLEDPNPYEDTVDFLERLYGFLYIAGNTYMEAVTATKDKPVELYVWRPDRTKITPDERGYPAKYTYTMQGGERSYEVDFGNRKKQKNIMHMKFFHPTDDWYGLSPMESALKSIATHNEAAEYNKKLLQNQAKPSGVLTYEGTKNGDNNLSDAQYKRLKSQIDNDFSGTQNAGKPLLLEGGLKWNSISMTQEELEFLEAKNSVAREICFAFGVPPMLAGIPGDNTFANYREANRAFYRQTVLPLVNRSCRALTKFFKPSYGKDFSVLYDIDKVEALSEEREAAWGRVNTSTFLKINEKREELNFAPVEGGDVVLVPSSSISLEDVGFTGGGEEPPIEDDPKKPAKEDDDEPEDDPKEDDEE